MERVRDRESETLRKRQVCDGERESEEKVCNWCNQRKKERKKERKKVVVVVVVNEFYFTLSALLTRTSVDRERKKERNKDRKKYR